MKHVARRLQTLIMTAVIVLVAVPGCSPQDETDVTPQDRKSARRLTVPAMDELDRLSVSGIYEDAITLTDGRWEGAPVEEGAASRPVVGLVRDFYLSGDLDGNWPPEAIITLWETSGGSAVNSYLAVVQRRDGNAVNIGTALIGDRVQLRAARVVDQRIELDLVQQGPADAACCPTETITRVWELDDDGLREGEPVHKGVLSLASIEGQEWQLDRMGRDEAIPDGMDATLTFINGRIAGRGGCNSFFGSVTAGDKIGEITLGQIGSTRMACPPAVMDLEGRYLQALSNVTGFGFLNGRLALTTQQDGDVSMLLFSPRTPQS